MFVYPGADREMPTRGVGSGVAVGVGLGVSVGVGLGVAVGVGDGVAVGVGDGVAVGVGLGVSVGVGDGVAVGVGDGVAVGVGLGVAVGVGDGVAVGVGVGVTSGARLAVTVAVASARAVVGGSGVVGRAMGTKVTFSSATVGGVLMGSPASRRYTAARLMKVTISNAAAIAASAGSCHQRRAVPRAFPVRRVRICRRTCCCMASVNTSPERLASSACEICLSIAQIPSFQL